MKNILICGSAGGIGKGLTELFSNNTKFNVIQHYHQKEPEHEGFKIKADITNFNEIENMISSIVDRFKTIDILINTVGISIDGFAHKFSSEIWAKVININLIGSFNIIRSILPYMRENKYGRIINLSSVVFQKPVVGTSAYSASKAGLVGLTRTIALENISKGITCNCISLGYYNTGILYQIPEDLREKIRDDIPIKRFGAIDEIYKTINYLIETEYITGQIICVNGGLFMI